MIFAISPCSIRSLTELSFPESKKSLVQKKDIISIEFDADLEEDKSSSRISEFIGRAIDSISAIALGESKSDTPGFPGVRALSELQAFNQNQTEEKPKGTTQMPTKEEIMAGLNTDIVREWVTANERIMVGMIFPDNRYMPDFIEDETAKGTGRGHYKNGEKSIRKLLNDHQDRVNNSLVEIEKERKEYATRAERSGTISSVLDSIKGKKMPEAVKKELESRIQELDLEVYKSDKNKAISQYVDKIVESELKVIARYQGDDQANKMREDWFKDSSGKGKEATKETTEEKSYLEEEEEEQEEEGSRKGTLTLPKDED
ncbi:hypothetical protein EHQ90_07580 [Leptospira stimsonii]|uniref:Uncharacterized protein n=1 Tax=Leptospira stimsonii TaxID=2202203 RepID=A0ABY2N567_9LEPT|nr:hypothetical protein [Leptospira stimsonii]TGM17236.1 hypothetical protein EHQ90_07580 [Leptospira stimsonii]